MGDSRDDDGNTSASGGRFWALAGLKSDDEKMSLSTGSADASLGFLFVGQLHGQTWCTQIKEAT